MVTHGNSHLDIMFACMRLHLSMKHKEHEKKDISTET